MMFGPRSGSPVMKAWSWMSSKGWTFKPHLINGSIQSVIPIISTIESPLASLPSHHVCQAGPDVTRANKVQVNTYRLSPGVPGTPGFQ